MRSGAFRSSRHSRPACRESWPAASSRLADEPEALGRRCSFGAVRGAELAEDARHVNAGGLLAHVERLADLAVGAPASHELENFEFAGRQAQVVLRRWLLLGSGAVRLVQ